MRAGQPEGGAWAPLALLPSSSFGILGPQKVHAGWALQACFSDAQWHCPAQTHPDASHDACYHADVQGSNHPVIEGSRG